MIVDKVVVNRHKECGSWIKFPKRLVKWICLKGPKHIGGICGRVVKARKRESPDWRVRLMSRVSVLREAVGVS